MGGKKVPLKLMYITNRPDIAQIAEAAGVDRIFIDMEYLGKQERQKNLDTVQSHHTLKDLKNIRAAVPDMELLVRCNPIHPQSGIEIEEIIAQGADIIMLPYFKTQQEAGTFIEYVGGRCKICLLAETVQAVEHMDAILSLSGIDEMFIGLNDLHLDYGKRFMFELLTDGTVERLCRKFRERGLPFGFGGIAGLGKGQLPAERIIREHYRLGSGSVILSRSFCNVEQIHNIGTISSIFINGIREIRTYEAEVESYQRYFLDNQLEIEHAVEQIVEEKEKVR